MDIEKTYELMNELQIFKNLLQEVKGLDLKNSNYSSKDYFSIMVNIMNELSFSKRKEVIESVKICLIPTIETKIKELEEEIRNGK